MPTLHSEEKSLFYKYTKNNLLIQPEKYQFSLFEGESFIEAWLNSREEILDQSEQASHFSSLTDHFEIDEEKVSQWIQKQRIDHISDLIVTRNLLCDLHQQIQNQDFNYKKSHMLLFIRRFEISKKIYAAYDTVSFKRVGKENGDLINYALFSILLAKAMNFADLEDQFIFFNCILKINDLLISIKNDLTSSNQNQALFLACFYEFTKFHQLKEKYQ